MNPLDTIFSRLPHPPRKAPARGGAVRAYRAACPVCESHGMPLSLAESSNGLPLLHCFGGCSQEELLGALGLTWGDVLPKPAQQHVPSNGGPSTWGALAAAIDALHHAHCRVLATCSPAMKTGEIEAALRAVLDAGAAMEQVKAMARQAMVKGGAA